MCKAPARESRFAPSTLAWAMIRMLLKGPYDLGSLPGRHDMPLASGSEADFASRGGRYQALDRSNTFRGGRFRPRRQTVFPEEDDISKWARSVYRSATGGDQRIAFPGIRGTTLE
jgi:hypothetical protein